MVVSNLVGFTSRGMRVLIVYKGIPATQSLQSITKAERLAQGKQGGVIRIAYMTAIAPKVGDNLGTTISGGSGAGGVPPLGVDEVFPHLLNP